MDSILLQDLAKAHDKAIYWKQRCLLAEEMEKNSPCDPDITPLQMKAHKEYNEFIKNHQEPK